MTGTAGPPHKESNTEQAIRHLEVVAAAGRALSASLDLGVLEQLARLLVPGIADICAIDLFERDGSADRVAAVHAVPDQEALVVELGRYLPSLASHPTIAAAVQEARPVLAPEIDQERLLAFAQSDDEAALLRRLGVRSGMVVPMRAHGRSVGVLTLAQAGSDRRFDEGDLALAQDIAAHAALVAENAMLFRDVAAAGHRYRTVAEGVDAIVWEAQPDPFRLIFVNDRASTILGYPVERWAEAGSWTSIVHPDDRSWVTDRLERAGKLGEVQELEYRMATADGRFVWLHDRVFPETTDDGTPTRLIGVSVDVTERRAVEMRQRAQLETTKIFAEAESPTEIPARILHALLTTLGWDCGALWETAGTVLRCVEFDQVSGVHVPAFEAATWRSAFERGRGLPGRVLASGRSAWIQDVTLDDNFPRAAVARESDLRGAFAFPIMAGGIVQGVLEFFSREARTPDEGLLQLVDVIGVQMGQFMRRRRVEEDLRASQTRLRAIVDTELDATLTMDGEGLVTDVNPAATLLFGYTPDQMIGRPLSDLVVPPGLRARHRAGLERYLRTGRSRMIGKRVEVPAMRADGTEFPAELSIGVHSESGEPIFTGFIRDMTVVRDSERRRTALHSISRALADAADLADGARKTIETICGTFDWEIGLMWQVERGGTTMRVVTSWQRTPDRGTSFITESYQSAVEPAVGLLGRVWETKMPIWLHDVSEHPDYVRAQAAAAEGYKAVFAIPVIWAGQVVGALEFYSHRIREPDEDLQRMMAGIGLQIGGFIERTQRSDESTFQRTLLRAQSEATIDGLLILSPDEKTLLRNQRFVEMFRVPEDIVQSGSDEDVLNAVIECLANPNDALSRIEFLSQHPDVLDRDELELRDGRVFDRYTAPVVDDAGVFHGRIWSFRDVTEAKRTERALHEVNLRTSFLADVSSALVGSLDPRRMLTDLVRMAVPTIADWCAVDLVRPDGTLDRVALVHRDRARVRFAEELRRRGIGVRVDPNASRGVSHVVLTGRSELEPDIPDGWIAEGLKAEPDLLEATLALGFRSYICVPLIARDRTLGALTFVTSESGRRYKTADLWLAEDVARRVAMALDNARLYGESAQVARTLQQSLIPPDLPAIPGLQIAARFRPAGGGVEVGGDFYDLFNTGRGDWAVVIGDVCGKGAEAAAVTALARYTIRATAMETRRPRAVLRRLNEALLHQRSDERFCTVAYVRVRSATEGFRLTASSAGHPMPLVLRRDGTIQAAGDPGMLLGAFPEVRLTEQTVEIRPGDAVILFTDGVTEAGRGSQMLGEEGVVRALANLGGASANAIADALEGAALSRLEGGQRDDIAIVVLRAEEVGTT